MNAPLAMDVELTPAVIAKPRRHWRTLAEAFDSGIDNFLFTTRYHRDHGITQLL